MVPIFPILGSQEEVAGTIIPTLILHGLKDKVVPHTHSLDLYRASAAAKKVTRIVYQRHRVSSSSSLRLFLVVAFVPVAVVAGVSIVVRVAVVVVVMMSALRALAFRSKRWRPVLKVRCGVRVSVCVEGTAGRTSH